MSDNDCNHHIDIEDGASQGHAADTAACGSTSKSTEVGHEH